MSPELRYVAKVPDANGMIAYTAEENEVWQILYHRQLALIKNRACSAYFEGVEKLGLNIDHVPQCAEISKSLKKYTGWSVAPVAALISFKEFFDLLAAKTFPAASFIRRKEDLDYLPEPDIFHEIFGHCPLLVNPAFAAFSETVGKFGQTLAAEDRKMLAKLYWFTVEFGLMNTKEGLRIYGAGILSSKEESAYSLESPIPQRKPFDLIEILRTPYRYDELQKIYFVIDSFETLFDLVNRNLLEAFQQAKALGTLPEIIDDYRSC